MMVESPRSERKIVAHGVSRGDGDGKNNQPRRGRKNGARRAEMVDIGAITIAVSGATGVLKEIGGIAKKAVNREIKELIGQG